MEKPWNCPEEENQAGNGVGDMERRGFRSDPMALCSFLRRGCGDGGAELFSLGSRDSMPGNGSKLHRERVRLDIGKHLYQEGGQALGWTSWRGGQCPKPVSVEEAFGQHP